MTARQNRFPAPGWLRHVQLLVMAQQMRMGKLHSVRLDRAERELVRAASSTWPGGIHVRAARRLGPPSELQLVAQGASVQARERGGAQICVRSEIEQAGGASVLPEVARQPHWSAVFALVGSHAQTYQWYKRLATSLWGRL